ncbi:MAG: hypothetical protein ABL995_16270 [Bryobacteraceae bacterium]
MKCIVRILVFTGMLCGFIDKINAAGANTSPPFQQCPAIGANSSCAVLIVINPGGSLTMKVDPTQGPYDGYEDTLVGVLNNSGRVVTHITLSGVGVNGEGIFGFDYDGICDSQFLPFAGSGYCAHLPAKASGYEGPKTTFTDISADEKTGTVVFAGGLANGESTYFSLEDEVTASTPIVPPAPLAVPVPNSVMLVAIGLCAAALYGARRARGARQN